MSASMMNPILSLTPELPHEEHALVQAEHGWHQGLVDFLQNGAPKIAVAIVLSALATWIVSFFVRRLRRRADALVANTHRAGQLRTIASILRASSYGLIGAYLFIQVLGAVGVPLGPFIASAGVIGLGISFGAQSIFKDVLNGLLILLEDQFSVGDVIRITGLTGTVEDLTLRITKLRDADGTLYIVPNSQITTVSNQSRDYSIATLKVSVDTRENPDRVVAVLNKMAAEVRADEAFQDVVLADPVMLGVDLIAGHEVVYPINLRVRANQRDGVLRALRRRILIAFQKEGIAFGATTSTVLMQQEPSPTPDVEQ